MAQKCNTGNRFEGFGRDEESPEKRTDTRTTPEAFKPSDTEMPEAVSIGQPSIPSTTFQIERINRARPPAPPAKALDKRVREPGSRDGSLSYKPVANAWAVPLAPKVAAKVGPKAAPKPKNKEKPAAKAAKAATAVKLVKVESAVRPQGDIEFFNAMKTDAPELIAQIEKEVAIENQTWYTVEVSCTPDPKWGTSAKGPDLERFEVERKLLQALAANAGSLADHSIKMKIIKSMKEDGLLRKRFFYQLSCTSPEGLAAICAHHSSKEWKGYTVAFYQPKDSRFGFRFQYNIAGLPAPFNQYTVADWLQIFVSQGWDASSITYMTVGVVADPGQMSRRTGMIDIYVKPEACSQHGCDGALYYAGTDQQTVGKVIDYPPSQILLGRNSAPEAQELIASGMCMGQYYTAHPSSRPAQGPLNSMLELQVGAYLPQQDYGKTWLRKTVKLGACRFCWGPKHESRDTCMYSGICKECLVEMKDLPGNGYHHACRSLVISQDKADRKTEETAKKRKNSYYDPGMPPTPAMAVYKQSALRDKRQKTLEGLKQKQLDRMAAEQAAVEAANAEAAARDEADLIEYEKYLNDVELDDEDHTLTQEEIQAQDAALAEMEGADGPRDDHMDEDDI
jgi:hypothetical protein